MKKQDVFTRNKRLRSGCCPTHGIGLAQTGRDHETGKCEAGCPRRDCTFRIWLTPKQEADLLAGREMKITLGEDSKGAH